MGKKSRGDPRAKASAVKATAPFAKRAHAADAQSRLKSARFRDLNETLYTTSGADALTSTTEETFDAYHEGYRLQVEKWPRPFPLEVAAALLRAHVKNSLSDKSKTLVVDSGCGEAKLAEHIGGGADAVRLTNNERTLPGTKTKLSEPLHFLQTTLGSTRVHVCPLDLVEKRESGINRADVNSHWPLPDGTADIAVSCLALMGTDAAGCVREAWRVLTKNGRYIICEVRSRFENVDSLIAELEQLGFKAVQKLDKNEYFFALVLRRTSRAPDPTLVLGAKACIYKRR